MKRWKKFLVYAIIAFAVTAHVHAASNLTLVATASANWIVNSVDWSADDAFIASGQANSVFPQLLVYALQTNGLSCVLTQSYATTRSVNAVQWGGGPGYTLAVGLSPDYGSDTDVFFYTFSASNKAFSATNGIDLGITQPANAIAWRPNSSQVAVGTINPDATGYLRLYNYIAGGISTVTTFNALFSKTVQPGAMSWNASGNYMALGLDNAGAPFAFDVVSFSNSTFAEAASVNPSGSQPVKAIAWNPTTNVIAAGLPFISPQKLQLFNFSSVTGLSELVGVQGTVTNKTVTSVDWNSTGDLLAVGLGDVTYPGTEIRVYFFNCASGTLSLIYEADDLSPVNTVKWSHGGRLLAAGDNQNVNVYRVNYTDLAIKKTSSPYVVRPGRSLTYSIVVTNSGPDAAQSVQIIDKLPTNKLTFVSAVSSTGFCSQATGIVTCAIGNLSVGSCATVTISAVVSRFATGSITNTAQVSSATGDTVPSNDAMSIVTSINTTPYLPPELDFDGDSISDIAVWWPAGGTWYALKSSGQNISPVQLGWSGAMAVAGDYDGDHITDYAVFYPAAGNWYILQSSNSNLVTRNWGWNRVTAVPADYDGDGKTDLAVYDPPTGTWYINPSSNNQPRVVQWGPTNAIPVPADYDGDGKADLAVYVPATGMWYIKNSSNGTARTQNWGWYQALPVPADYDGDGKADLAVYYPATGQWSILQSHNNSLLQVNWGWSQAIPVPSDYDGDGKADITVYAPSEGNWYVLQSYTGTLRKRNWGWSEALPVASQAQINRHYFPTP